MRTRTFSNRRKLLKEKPGIRLRRIRVEERYVRLRTTLSRLYGISGRPENYLMSIIMSALLQAKDNEYEEPAGPEMFAEARQRTLGIANLSVVPRIEQKAAAPFVIAPKLEYIDFLSNHCRASYNAAKLLSLLIFRCQRNRPGEKSSRLEVIRQGGRWGAPAYWWLHTREQIAAECGLTQDQVRQAVATLIRLGIVDARQGRHPINGEVPCYRGKTVWHLRLGVCQRGNGLTGWPSVADLVQMRIVLDGDKSPLINGEQSPTLLPDTLKDLDTEQGKNINPVAEKPATATKLSLVHPGKPVNPQNPKPTPKPLRPEGRTPTPIPQPPAPVKTSPEEFDDAFLGPVPTMPPLPGGSRPAKIVRAWFDGMACEYPHAGSDLTRPNCRRLTNIGNKVFLAAQDRYGFIAFMTAKANWLDFVWDMRCLHRDVKPVPNIEDLEKHLPAAIAFYVEKTKPKPASKFVKNIEAAAVQKPTQKTEYEIEAERHAHREAVIAAREAAAAKQQAAKAAQLAANHEAGKAALAMLAAIQKKANPA